MLFKVVFFLNIPPQKKCHGRVRGVGPMGAPGPPIVGEMVVPI